MYSQCIAVRAHVFARVYDGHAGQTYYANGKFGKSDGIIGLAFPPLAAKGTVNFFDNLMQQVGTLLGSAAAPLHMVLHHSKAPR